MFFRHFIHSGTSPLPLSGGGGIGDVRAEAVDSDSEDLSPTPSLDEISSDELSWLGDRARGGHKHHLPTVKALMLLKQPRALRSC